MRRLFPGYFTPTKEEFDHLWSEAQFGFDANVLLGLYRSSTETQQVFFAVLEKIGDRIFLPHQAAYEYLKNRLGVISGRAASYAIIRSESEKLTKVLESTIQEHALPNGKEIVTVAKEAAKKIVDLVEAAEKEEPDLLRADPMLVRLAELFGTKTGEPYEQTKLKENYAEAARRYAQGTPPGYKDDTQGEPGKFGDALIWFQLIDQAKLTKKPIIFVTGDVKEDWWLQHKGATLGPRPELRQEMMAAAGVQFYMYTTPRFLEFAKQFLNLSFDTKKAETEFEKIEKQDKEAAEQFVFRTDDSFLNNQIWQNWTQNFFARGSTNIPATSQEFWAQPDYNPSTPSWPIPKTESVNSESMTKYVRLLPVNGYVFESSTGKWKCEIVSEPSPVGSDRACYGLKFDPEDRMRKPRYLELWVSAAGLHHDTDWKYKSAIFGVISQWLGSNQSSGRIAYFT